LNANIHGELLLTLKSARIVTVKAKIDNTVSHHLIVDAAQLFRPATETVMHPVKERNYVKGNNFRLLATITKKAMAIIKGLFFYFVYVL
jgi:hypothetical protein